MLRRDALCRAVSRGRAFAYHERSLLDRTISVRFSVARPKGHGASKRLVRVWDDKWMMFPVAIVSIF